MNFFKKAALTFSFVVASFSSTVPTNSDAAQQSDTEDKLPDKNNLEVVADTSRALVSPDGYVVKADGYMLAKEAEIDKLLQEARAMMAGPTESNNAGLPKVPQGGKKGKGI